MTKIDFILTNAAYELISKVLSGKTLNFTRMAVGDGFSYDLTTAKNYTALVNEVLSLDITKKETLTASNIKIISVFKNTDAQKEFYYREVGLFAQDPDTGAEVLYAYGNRNDAAELITPTGSNIITKQLVFIIAVGDSANVTFNVDADVYALQEDMVEVQADLGKAQADITTLQTNIKANQSKQNELEARMNTFVAVGSTSDNAETTDIRVGVNGKTYESAGDAVRGLSNDIIEISSYVYDNATATVLENTQARSNGGVLYYENNSTTNTITYDVDEIPFRLKITGKLTGASSWLVVSVDENGTLLDRIETGSTTVKTYDGYEVTITNVLAKKVVVTLNNTSTYSVKKRTKFAKSFKDVINAIEYGFINDGITTNDIAMANYITNDSNKPIYFPSGTYIFNNPIIFTDICKITMENDSEFKLNQATDTFITIDSSTDSPPLGSYWKGGIINGNYKCNTAINFGGMKYFKCSINFIKNFNVYGISTDSHSGFHASGLHVDGTIIRNDANPVYGTTAIYDKANDNWFTNIVIRDVMTGIVSASSKFINIHHWCQSSLLIPSSIFAHITGRNATFDACTIDTIRYGFKGESYCYAKITNLTIMVNLKFYPNELQAQYPITLFSNENNVAWVVNTLTFKITSNIYFADSSNFSPESLFSGILIHREGGTESVYNKYPYDDKSGGRIGVPQAVLTGASNFDNHSLTASYAIDTTTGTGGINVPLNVQGIMLVINSGSVGEMVSQFIIGKNGIFYRTRIASAWSDWNTIS